MLETSSEVREKMAAWTGAGIREMEDTCVDSRTIQIWKDGIWVMKNRRSQFYLPYSLCLSVQPSILLALLDQ